MASITLELPDDVMERLRREAETTDRDLEEVAVDLLVEDHRRAVELDEAFQRDLPQIMKVVEQRMKDPRPSRPAAEFFAELRAELQAEAARGEANGHG